jgi:hypothetical protein
MDESVSSPISQHLGLCSHQTIKVFRIACHRLDALPPTIGASGKVTLAVIFAIVSRRQGFRYDDSQVNGSVAKVDDGVFVAESPSAIEPVAVMAYTDGKSVSQTVAKRLSYVPPSVP